jgi:saccharopine dehydrogenase (NAD+, L-lysine-forming)
VIVGIRREDKNRWERRTPLVPEDVAGLVAQGIEVRVQPSSSRVFADHEFVAAGAEVAEDLGPCELVLAVKEIPTALLQPGSTYVYFAHVIKGQRYNMAMLDRLLELGCTLIDYERIADEDGRRLIYFSLHAGYAGMIDTLWTLGQRLQARGFDTPLADIRQTWQYDSLQDALAHLRAVGARLGSELPPALRPLVIGVAGYGNVARGCRAVLDCLPCEWIAPAALGSATVPRRSSAPVQCVEFREAHMVRHRDGCAFDLRRYYARPDEFESVFADYLAHLDVLVNTIYWEPRYPRLVTRDWARANSQPRLQAIGDISCDIEGSVELTLKSTMPDVPSFVWDPQTDSVTDGVEGNGPAIMAVDNLPCELPRESSEHFSSVLSAMVPALARCDWSSTFSDLALPPPLARAVITHRGRLTPDYAYLQEALSGARGN